MFETIQKLDNDTRLSLLFTTLGFAVLVIVLLNLLDSIVYILLLLKEPDYTTILISFKHSYYTINNKEMGFSFFYNILGALIIWVLMIRHTLKSICKPIGWNLFFDVRFL